MFFYHSIHDLIRNLSFYQPIVVHNNIMPEFLYFVYFLEQPIKWLFMRSYRHKNHRFRPLPKICCPG